MAISRLAITYTARDDHGNQTTIDVWDDGCAMIPDSPDLGMGHKYYTGTWADAARDLARRHGYKLETENATQ